MRAPVHGVFRARLIGLLAVAALSRCAPLLIPSSPKVRETRPSPPIPRDTLDFARAFSGTSIPVDSVRPPRADTVRSKTILRVPSCVARIALQRNRTRGVIYAVGEMEILAGEGKKKARRARGRIEIQSLPGSNRVAVTAAELGRAELVLPCTLRAEAHRGYVEIEEGTYRGSVILVSEARGVFSIINYLEIEEYLRGVVGLEIGPRPAGEIEAIKAQAIAARTYTYHRVLERVAQPFDLLSTVSDQVYGGVSAESRLVDRAVEETAGLVIAYGSDLIHAYYHSTCGGKTANIEEVWQKAPATYLRSINDLDPDGKPYCAISSFFDWRETWTRQQLSTIAGRFSREAFPNNPVEGIIQSVRVEDRTSCGRAKSCAIATSSGIYTYGGDRVRFVLRRAGKDYPILRSATITSCSVDHSGITIAGRGYGHGVGMCQMGAVGRARAGQSFREILETYYPGTGVRPVTCGAADDR